MEAHAIGYVHRDLRPRNIYLAVRRGKANFVKLLDFGLAKLVESDAQAASTSLGMTFGDPRYMSPEQARGDRIDRRADIYQLGCVAYEILTGAPPFTGNRVFDILTKQVTEIPSPLPTRRPGVPLWMEAAVAKMLAKDPENRFATTTRMVEALRRGLETGEVMEDEIARRRESIPPPSVSRVMQRMGMSAPAEWERSRDEPPLPGQVEATPGGPDKIDGSRTVREYVPPAAPEPAPPAASEVSPAVSERRRTGTPQVGIPVTAPAAPMPAMPAMPAAPAPMAPAAGPATQPAIAGSIEAATPDPTPSPPVVEAAAPAPAGRARRASSHGPGESASWYEEGERASEEAEEVLRGRARKLISPSTTDLSLYDEPPPRRRGLIIAAVLGVLVVGGGIAFAVMGGGDDTKPVTPVQPAPVALGVVATDAAPSTIIAAEPDASTVAPADAAAVAVAKTDPPPSPPRDPRHAGGHAPRDGLALARSRSPHRPDRLRLRGRRSVASPPDRNRERRHDHDDDDHHQLGRAARPASAAPTARSIRTTPAACRIPAMARPRRRRPSSMPTSGSSSSRRATRSARRRASRRRASSIRRTSPR